MVPMGWFFGTIVVTILAISLPRLAGQTIGNFSAMLWSAGGETSTAVVTPAQSVTVSPAASQVAAGTSLGGPTVSGSPGVNPMPTAASLGANQTVVAPAAAVGSSGLRENRDQRSSVSSGTEVKVSISKDTLKKIKSSIGSAFKNAGKKS